MARIEIHCELTKQGLVHAHGLLWYDDVGLYQSVYLLLATAWAKVSGGKVKAMSKYNPANGKTDYAFDKCNNVESWKKYIRKEATLEDFDEDTTELVEKLKNERIEIKRRVQLLDDGVEIHHTTVNKVNYITQTEYDEYRNQVIDKCSINFS